MHLTGQQEVEVGAVPPKRTRCGAAGAAAAALPCSRGEQMDWQQGVQAPAVAKSVHMVLMEMHANLTPSNACTCPVCMHAMLKFLASSCAKWFSTTDDQGVPLLFFNPSLSITNAVIRLVSDAIGITLCPCTYVEAEVQRCRSILAKQGPCDTSHLVPILAMHTASLKAQCITAVGIEHSGLAAACKHRGMCCPPTLSDSLQAQLREYMHSLHVHRELVMGSRMRIVSAYEGILAAGAKHGPTLGQMRDFLDSLPITSAPAVPTALAQDPEYITFMAAVEALTLSSDPEVKNRAVTVQQLCMLRGATPNPTADGIIPQVRPCIVK